MTRTRNLSDLLDANGDVKTASLDNASAAVEATSNSNTFTDADHTKLNAIEASADVTDATNVAAAGALMTSGGTVTGDINFGDDDKAVFGAGSDLQLYHASDNHSNIRETGSGNLQLWGSNTNFLNTAGSKYHATFADGGAVTLYHNGNAKLATTSSGVSVTGTATATTFQANAGGTFTTASGNDLNIVYPDSRSLFIKEGSTTHVTVNNVGNVGISNTAPDFNLSVGNSSSVNPSIQIMSATNSNAQLLFGDGAGAAGYRGTVVYGNATDSMSFSTAGSERMRLSSSGSLLAGKTAADSIPTDGIEIDGPNGRVLITRDGSEPLILNRKTSDGVIVDFRKDSTTVGSISTIGGDMVAGTGDTGLRFHDGADQVYPSNTNGSGRDAAIDLGNNGARFKDGYFSGQVLAQFFTGVGDTDTYMDISSNPANTIKFYTGGGERARFDSSGRFAVGKVPDSNFNAGCELDPAGFLIASRAANVSGYFNRNSDGDILDFRKSSTTAGTIGTFDNGVNLYIGSGDTGLTFNPTVNGILPHNPSTNAQLHNAIDLGYSNVRFKKLWLSNDVNTSGYVYAAGIAGSSDGNTYVQFPGSDIMQFYTGGAEKARVTSSSTPTILVGCTVNPSASAPGSMVSTTGAGSFTSFAAANTASTHAVFGNLNGAVGTIQTTNSTTAYNTSSDRRLKSNIEDAASASDKIDAIQVRQFDWNADNSHQDYGLIAQELQPIEPLAVTGDADSDEMMGVDYSKLVPMLLKEIQSLRSRVAALES